MYLRLPSLKALRAVEAVVRHRSVTKASEELHVSPGAVSHQLRALEEELGFSLFDRSSGELVPTDAAGELAEQVREGFERIFGAVRRLRLGGDPSFLTIGCDVSFGMLWLGPRIRRFQEQHPEIEVRLDLTDFYPDFSWRSVDVAVYFGHGRLAEHDSTRLTSEYLFPVCAPSLPASAGLRSPADLQACRLLHVTWLEPDASFGTLAWEQWLAEAGVRTSSVRLRGMHFSHTANALQAAMAGGGVALSSECLAADAIAAGSLIRPFDVPLKLPRHYFLACHRANSGLAKVEAFRAWVLAETLPLRAG